MKSLLALLLLALAVSASSSDFPPSPECFLSWPSCMKKFLRGVVTEATAEIRTSLVGVNKGIVDIKTSLVDIKSVVDGNHATLVQVNHEITDIKSSLKVINGKLDGLQKCTNPRCQRRWDRYDGACYKLLPVDSSLTPDSAQAACEGLHDGATLTSIHSANEQKYVHELLKNAKFDAGFIGLTHSLRSSRGNSAPPGQHASPAAAYHFSWSDKTELEFSQWESGYPRKDAQKSLGAFLHVEKAVWWDNVADETSAWSSAGPQVTGVCKYVPTCGAH